MSQRAPEEQIDEIIDQYTKEVLDALIDELEAEEIDEEEWEEDTKRALLDLYIILAVFLLGTIELVTREMREQIDEALQIQYVYLDGLAAGLAAGVISIAEARRRIAMYGNSSRQAFWIVRDIQARDAGMTLERWIAIGDRNTCSSCLEADLLGPMPLGYFGRPGSGSVILHVSQCDGLTQCRCQKAYL